MANRNQIHLLIECLHGLPRWNGAIVIVAQAKPALIAFGANVAPRVTTDAAQKSIAVEALQGSVPRLAVSTHSDDILINGQPAPSIAVLRGGDEIDIAHDWRLHLAIYRAEPIVVTGDDLLARECPVCLSRFQPNTRVYVCACGVAMHIAGADAADELDCANAAGECANCRRSIDLHAGYESLPQEYDAVPVL